VTQREQVEALIKQPEASTLTAARPTMRWPPLV